MDPLVVEEEQAQFTEESVFNPITLAAQFLASYGWYLVGGAALVLYILHKLRPRIEAYKQAWEDAEYHKDPDKALSRMEAIQRARERQQQLLEQASLRAQQEQIERSERKRAENLERLEKYGTAAGGSRLGTPADDDFLPLSGGASASTYRPPKKSKCKGGGCGR